MTRHALVLGFVIGIGLLTYLCRDCPRGRGEGRPDTVFAEGGPLKEEVIRGRRIAEKQKHLDTQIQASDEVVTRMIAGTLVLSDAVDELERINADRSMFDPQMVPVVRQGATRRAVLAWYAIRKARERFGTEDAAHAAGVLTRLEGEFAALFGYQLSALFEPAEPPTAGPSVP
jgi:hypothetical protein